MSGTILSLGLAYACLLFVLLLVVFRSEVRVWIKFGLVVICCSFYFWHYQAVQSFIGWPAETRLPDRFQLISSFIVEPNQQRDEPGAIYLWVRDLDSEDTTPRSYLLDYDREAHNQVEGALDQQRQGERMVGVPSYPGGGKAPQIDFEATLRATRDRKTPLGN